MMPLPQQILVAAEVCGLFWLMFGLQCVVGACSSSDHLRWPLSPDVCTDQVLSNPDLHLRYCPLQFVDDVPPLPRTPSLDPHSVNLSAENSLDFRIYNAPSGDYGFSVFVKPAEETNSCILHYKSDDGSFEMKFTSTPTESVASIPGVVSCSFKPLPQGQWRKIGMSMDDSNAKINAFVDVEPFDDYKDDVQSAASIRVLPKFAVPGTLRVGGSFDGETYKGPVPDLSRSDPPALAGVGCQETDTTIRGDPTHTDVPALPDRGSRHCTPGYNPQYTDRW
uniref:Uncharacterized protein LOC111124398 n=1 Tax=Crassostrea virginica TaxID=6565 RepID=A0A8B8D4D6_CRAVI|nr:uncharacterized protein LOC111124398 [Crassostrea virginica]